MKIAWKDPKTKVAIAGVVVSAVGAYALYKRSQNGAAASTTTSDPTGASSALGDANLQSAVYDPLESQITSLAGEDTLLVAQNKKAAANIHSLQELVNKLAHLPHPKAASPAPTHPVAKPAPAKLVPIATASPIVAKLQSAKAKAGS